MPHLIISLQYMFRIRIYFQYWIINTSSILFLTTRWKYSQQNSIKQTIKFRYKQQHTRILLRLFRIDLQLKENHIKAYTIEIITKQSTIWPKKKKRTTIINKARNSFWRETYSYGGRRRPVWKTCSSGTPAQGGGRTDGGELTAEQQGGFDLGKKISKIDT